MGLYEGLSHQRWNVVLNNIITIMLYYDPAPPPPIVLWIYLISFSKNTGRFPLNSFSMLDWPFPSCASRCSLFESHLGFLCSISLSLGKTSPATCSWSILSNGGLLFSLSSFFSSSLPSLPADPLPSISPSNWLL